jgi:glycosyltransferase involved in cell wall biosynthesis
MKNDLTVSLIVPAYNEEVNIQKGVLDKIGNYTREHGEFSEVLLVDDGSTDGTINLIKDEYIRKFPRFRLVESKHAGKAQAIITGIKEAKSNVAMFTDIDLATPIEEGEKLLNALKNGHDIAIGSRNTHREGAPLLRKIMAVGFIFIRNTLIGLKDIKDTQCGFKAFDRMAALKIISKLMVFKKQSSIAGSSVKAGFDLEFLFVAIKLGYRIKEIPVTWKHVETKNVNFFRDFIDTMKDILAIKYYDLTKKYD